MDKEKEGRAGTEHAYKTDALWWKRGRRMGQRGFEMVILGVLAARYLSEFEMHLPLFRRY